MRLRSIGIQGFRSFTTEQALDFTSLQPGLYHVQGVNLTEPALEANGAGKSSLFEAPYWCLYGKTTRDLHGDAVVNWQGKERCFVITELDVPAGRLAVLRARNPNTLDISLNGEEPRPISQEDLETLLGMGPEMFLYSIHFAQFVPAFVDLRPAEQMAVYSAVLNLEVWEVASDRAAAANRDLEPKIIAGRETLARLEGQAEQLLATAYKKQERDWDVAQKKKALAQEASLHEARAAVAQTLLLVKAAETGAAEFRARREVVQQAAAEVAKYEHEERRLKQELITLRSKNYTKCPTCGASVTRTHILKEIQNKEKEFKKAAAAAKTAVTLHDVRMKDMVQFQDAEMAYSEAKTKEGVVTAGVQAAVKRLQELQQEPNPYTQQREAQQKQAAALEQEMGHLEVSLKHLSTAQAAAQFWVKEFKELRLSIIQESLAQLTVETNESLFQLGLPDWSIAFDTERVTKSKTVDKNFTTQVQAPNVEHAVPWKVWSGGESQRLRLAVALGFNNLICSQLEVQPSVEFFDEPTQWLSSTGVESLLSILSERAKRYRKVILLADHRSFAFGEFVGTIEVIKDKNGSRLNVGTV